MKQILLFLSLLCAVAQNAISQSNPIVLLPAYDSVHTAASPQAGRIQALPAEETGEPVITGSTALKLLVQVVVSPNKRETYGLTNISKP
ncbi:hypothetical protein U0033_31725 [Chitinophaga sancti]|uniref:Uncharacterized protein n=1 Tax=Chitinophaga sancti TaxID=1004 RepID=A0ABZ0XP27_9BACT|nr:hypothetical protein [Chitinophaga sancti]WQD62463.1 hypothetical protein U0033_31725 [Chitinophaga sancti]WQG91968.1 hypothetical protein SR876_10660 [Chitinophaga sancti]